MDSTLTYKELGARLGVSVMKAKRLAQDAKAAGLLDEQGNVAKDDGLSEE